MPRLLSLHIPRWFWFLTVGLIIIIGLAVPLLINLQLFDLELAITLLIVEVPIAVLIAWLIPIILQQQRREMHKQLMVEEQRAESESKQRRSEVFSKLNLYDSNWARLKERISRRKSLKDDPDIPLVRSTGNQLNTILATLKGDYSEKDIAELKALATDIVTLGTDIMKAFGGRSLPIDDILMKLIKRGDQLLETIKELKGKLG